MLSEAGGSGAGTGQVGRASSGWPCSSHQGTEWATETWSVRESSEGHSGCPWDSQTPPGPACPRNADLRGQQGLGRRRRLAATSRSGRLLGAGEGPAGSTAADTGRCAAGDHQQRGAGVRQRWLYPGLGPEGFSRSQLEPVGDWGSGRGSKPHTETLLWRTGPNVKAMQAP